MTTSKTAAKGAEARRPRSEPPEELQAAYQIHTLAHLLYGQIAATHPWAGPTPHPGYPSVFPPTFPPATPAAFQSPFSPASSMMFTPTTQPWAGFPHCGYTPVTGFEPPGPHGWTGPWGAPIRWDR